MRVLLVEDEIGISEPLCKLLEKNNIPTDAVYDGVSALIQGEKNIYDVIVLDIMLPEMDGMSVLKALRQKKIYTPVLFLTAKDELEDKIVGLESGGDDYMTKPFSSLELIARVKALARRRTDTFFSDLLKIGDVTLNVNNASMTVADGPEEKLSAKEYHIMEILIHNAGNIISKEFLIDKVWGMESEAVENTVEIYIHYLRKKLERSQHVSIVTKRNLGYLLKED
jgi:DNA-binding response OmpR family regulator